MRTVEWMKTKWVVIRFNEIMSNIVALHSFGGLGSENMMQERLQ